MKRVLSLFLFFVVVSFSYGASKNELKISSENTYTYTVDSRFLKIEMLAKMFEVSIKDLCEFNKGVSGFTVFKLKQNVNIPIVRVRVNDFSLTYEDISNKYSVSELPLRRLNKSGRDFKNGDYVILPLNDKTRHLQTSSDDKSSSNVAQQSSKTSGNKFKSVDEKLEFMMGKQKNSTSTTSSSKTKPSTQDNINKVTLITNGEAKTKDEAIKIALRSALEQAFGTFVSSNTTVLNDNVVKDEIITLSRGNIQNYEEISCIELKNGNKDVTVKATVSIDKLTSYAKSKGMTTELAGATLAMNVKVYELNKQNELKALNHIWKQANEFLDAGIYDFTIKKTFVKQCNGKFISVIEVEKNPNDNYKMLVDFLEKSLKDISVQKEEYDALKELGVKLYVYSKTQDFSNKEDDIFNLHSRIELRGKFNDYFITRNDFCFENGYRHIRNEVLFNQQKYFEISDNLGNSRSGGSIKRLKSYDYPTIVIAKCVYGENSSVERIEKDNAIESYYIDYTIDEISKVTGYKISYKK